MNNDFVTILAPAKVNLSLVITQKMTSGFHFLETIFQTVSLYDQVAVRLREQGISCLCGEFSGKTNLAYRAAEVFFEELQQWSMVKGNVQSKLAGVEIQIEKAIPAQAGLGGGSSDAAAVLRVMNHLYGNPLSAEALLRCASCLGSDTAFFLSGGTQWGEGTGTSLSSLPPLPRMDLILVKPDGGISTAEAYHVFDQIGSLGKLDRTLWVKWLEQKDKNRIATNMTNVLEAAAFSLRPEIEECKVGLLENGCQGALMSGSGSAVFGILESKEHGEEVAQKLQRIGYPNSWVVHTIDGLPSVD